MKLTKEEFKNIMDNFDWIEIHKNLISFDSGWNLWFFADGETSVLTNQTIHNPDSGGAEYMGSFPCISDNYEDEYYDGWATKHEDTEGNVYYTNDNEDGFENESDDKKTRLTEKEMIDTSIEDGDWTDYYDFIKNELYYEYYQDRKENPWG